MAFHLHFEQFSASIRCMYEGRNNNFPLDHVLYVGFEVLNFKHSITATPAFAKRWPQDKSIVSIFSMSLTCIGGRWCCTVGSGWWRAFVLQIPSTSTKYISDLDMKTLDSILQQTIWFSLSIPGLQGWKGHVLQGLKVNYKTGSLCLAKGNRGIWN